MKFENVNVMRKKNDKFNIITALTCAQFFPTEKKSILCYERLYGDVIRYIPFQPFFGQKCWEKKKIYYERYDKGIFSDLNSNLQASSCDDSMESLHAYSGRYHHVIIKASSMLYLKMIKIL